MLQIIDRIDIVKSDVLHFTCSICKNVDTSKEYIRIFEVDSPNGVCVHSSCLLEFIKENKKHINTTGAFSKMKVI